MRLPLREGEGLSPLRGDQEEGEQLRDLAEEGQHLDLGEEGQ